MYRYQSIDSRVYLLYNVVNKIMSTFMKLFGGSKGKPPNSQEAIQKLRETTEMLQKKSDFLEKKIEHEVATAKRHGTKNKRCK